MELFTLVLQIHIIGAAVLAALLVAVLTVLLRPISNSDTYKAVAILLAFTALFEIVTGSVMYVIAAESNFTVFCVKMGIYLGVTAFAEYMLIRQIRLESSQQMVVADTNT